MCVGDLILGFFNLFKTIEMTVFLHPSDFVLCSDKAKLELHWCHQSEGAAYLMWVLPYWCKGSDPSKAAFILAVLLF